MDLDMDMHGGVACSKPWQRGRLPKASHLCCSSAFMISPLKTVRSAAASDAASTSASGEFLMSE